MESMGIKIKEFVNKEEIELSELAGKVIAVDAPNIIFSLFSFNYGKSGHFMDNIFVDSTSRAITHLSQLLYRVKFYYTKKILPIFCFDGRESYLKGRVNKNIIKNYSLSKERYERAFSIGKREIAKNIALSRNFFWLNTMEESKKLLGLLGVPVIISPSSAEAQCSKLVKSGLAHFSHSQDYDSLLYGCPFILQDFSKTSKIKVGERWKTIKKSPNLIRFNDFIRRLNINRFQLIDIALLIGVDYFKGIKGIGPKTALSLIKKYGSLEKLMYYEKDKYNFSELKDWIIKKIRSIFLFPEVLENINNLTWNHPDKDNIIDFLCNNHTLKRRKVENNLNKLIWNFKSCKRYHKALKNGDIYKSVQSRLSKPKAMKKLVM